MDFNKKILALLAIFCVIVSAGMVCAADVADDGGYAGSNYEDANGYSGSQYDDNQDLSDDGTGNGEDDTTTYGAAGEPEPGNGLPLENQTGNITVNATGNTTGNVTGNAAGNVTANTTGNATGLHNMLSTGNALIILIVVIAIIGGYAVLRRK